MRMGKPSGGLACGFIWAVAWFSIEPFEPQAATLVDFRILCASGPFNTVLVKHGPPRALFESHDALEILALNHHVSRMRHCSLARVKGP